MAWYRLARSGLALCPGCAPPHVPLGMPGCKARSGRTGLTGSNGWVSVRVPMAVDYNDSFSSPCGKGMYCIHTTVKT